MDKFYDHPEKFQLNMCDAVTKAQPYCCVGSLPCTMYCMQCKLRYDILNLLGNGMSDYVCCQGYFPPCCCFHPGKCGEKCVGRAQEHARAVLVP